MNISTLFLTVALVALFCIFDYAFIGTACDMLIDGALPYVITVIFMLATILIESKDAGRDFNTRRNIEFSIRMFILESFIVLDNIRYATECLNQSRLALAMSETNSVFSNTLSKFSNESKEWTSSCAGLDAYTWQKKTIPSGMYSPGSFYRQFDYYASYYMPTKQVYTMDDFTRTYTKGELISKFYRTIELMNGRSFEDRYKASVIQFEAYRNVFMMRYNRDLRAKKCYGYGTVETSDLLEQLIPGGDYIRNQNIENRNSIQRQLNEHRARLHPEIEDTSPSAIYGQRLREIRKNQSYKFKYCGSGTRDMYK